MHDCPGCRVPLHGYEEVCPSCGTPQVVRKRGPISNYKVEEPGVGIAPFIAIFAVILIGLVFFVPNSWIGQLIKQGPPPVDPMASVTYQEARQNIESKITEGLTAVGAKGTFTWQSPGGTGEKADLNTDATLDLNIDTSLPNPEMRKSIVDAAKPWMEKAKMSTLTMNDARSHATWTYTVSQPLTPTEPDAGTQQ